MPISTKSKKTPSQRDKYTYKDLMSCKNNDGKVHFYATILDAQFPHKSFKSDKYVCSMKIADQSCNIEKSNGWVKHCTLVLFANKFEDLPISQKVGDIIRIHRATVGEYKGSKQFTANVFFNSSWAMFAPSVPKKSSIDIEFRPYQFFGKALSFDNSECKILRGLRKWANSSFENHTMLSDQFITRLSDLKGIQQDEKHFDFDLQVKVLQMVKLDDYTSECRVIDDSNEIWHVQVLN